MTARHPISAHLSTLAGRLRSRVQAATPGQAGRTRRRVSGFSFIEILVVLIILALLAGLVGTQLIGEAESAKAQTTKIQMQSLSSALDLYRLHNSTYPSTDQGLEALLAAPEVGTLPRNWQGPYINANNLPEDGWNQPFVYESDGRTYTILSFGADGVEGGTELNADISSREL